ncbi:MAG TPA: type II secretion system F family protein [Solirubrobacteraceae bacterium]|nr:type II secretion system F family protein [Solirubrobacteraceae bacterium]
MSAAGLMALAAGAAAVAGAWELLAAVERARAWAWIDAALRALRRAHGEGRPPTAPERRRLAALATGCLLGAGWIVGGAALALPAAVAGPALAAAVVRAGRRRYRARLAAGAAGAARALAASLAAGRSVRSAVAEAAAGLEGPVAHELRHAAAALAAGEPTDAALEALRRRAASPPWDALISGVLLQRDAGGDLAALLRDLAASLDAAERSERDALAATAQARFTAWLVAGLPALAAGLAELASPGFVAGLAGDPLSAALAVPALVLQAVALGAIRLIGRSALA